MNYNKAYQKLLTERNTYIGDKKKEINILESELCELKATKNLYNEMKKIDSSKYDRFISIVQEQINAKNGALDDCNKELEDISMEINALEKLLEQ